jgi:prepilin-type N-terminal cleavage/methylation domain-containing protein/prepilin-type processing-associated H-X9-DG protein
MRFRSWFSCPLCEKQKLEIPMSLLRSSRRAFTIVELMISITIIGVLMGLALPTISKAREAAKLTICLSNERQVLRGLSNYLTEFKDRQPLMGTYADAEGAQYFDYLHPVAVAQYLNIGGANSVAFDSTGMNGRWAQLARDISNNGIARRSVLFCPSDPRIPTYLEDGNGWMQLGDYAAGWSAWTPNTPASQYVDNGQNLDAPGELDRWLNKTLASKVHPDRTPAYVHAQSGALVCYGIVDAVNSIGNWNISGLDFNAHGKPEPVGHNGNNPIGWLDGHVTPITMTAFRNDYMNGGVLYGPNGESPIWDVGNFTMW